MNLEYSRIKEIVDNFSGKKVLIVGDVMIDEYLLGKVTRLSPEAPVPIIEIENETIRFGGAANVALNIKSLGCIPIIISLIGKDRMGDKFIQLMAEHEISVDGLVVGNRPTTLKTRIIGDNQHIARVDKEVKSYANQSEEKSLLDKISKLINRADALILEDYNKGVLTEAVIKHAINLANKKSIPIMVDPKFTNFLQYENVTVFKPNIIETEKAIAKSLETKLDIENAGIELLTKLNAESILLTRGSKGLSLFEPEGITNIPTLAKNVADVSGAGDTVISTVTAAILGGASLKEAAVLANKAAGIVVEEVGIVPIKKEKLIA